MPYLIKNTFVFGQNQSGWTESWFWQRGSNDLGANLSTLKSIAVKRANLLGTEAYIKAIRASVELDLANNKVLGDAQLEYVRYPGYGTESASHPDDALQVRWLVQGALRKKFMFMRGIWKSIVVEGGKFKPFPAWQSIFDSWRQAMLTAQCGWYGQIKGTPTEVTNYSQDVNTEQVLLTTKTAVFDVTDPIMPQVVRVKGVNGVFKSQLNGELLVKAVTPTSCQTVDAIAVRPFKSKGYLSTYTGQFQLAQLIDGQKIIERKAGAPLLESVGRRLVRVRS